MEDVCSIALDILMVLVFAGLCYWAVGSIFIASERTRMRESYVAYDGNTITYHMLKSRDSVRRFTQVYHTYYITGITNIVEGAYYYTVYGDIMLTITRNAHEESKQVREVKIPRYFEGLDRVLGDFYKICR